VFHIEEHWVREAKRVPSPNYNERPEGVDISLVVVHAISLPPNEFGGPYIDDFFQNRLQGEHPFFQEIAEFQVSAHFLIRRNGDLHQYVGCDKRAWHAGQSQWQGRENCNDFSIGIELEGADHIPYEVVQYERLAALIIALQNAYPSIRGQDHVVGHCHIAPGRKTDPGPAFDWDYLWHCMAKQGEAQ